MSSSPRCTMMSRAALNSAITVNTIKRKGNSCFKIEFVLCNQQFYSMIVCWKSIGCFRSSLISTKNQTTIEKSNHNGSSIIYCITQTLKIIYKDKRFRLTLALIRFLQF